MEESKGADHGEFVGMALRANALFVGIGPVQGCASSAMTMETTAASLSANDLASHDVERGMDAIIKLSNHVAKIKEAIDASTCFIKTQTVPVPGSSVAAAFGQQVFALVLRDQRGEEQEYTPAGWANRFKDESLDSDGRKKALIAQCSDLKKVEIKCGPIIYANKDRGRRRTFSQEYPESPTVYRDYTAPFVGEHASDEERANKQRAVFVTDPDAIQCKDAGFKDARGLVALADLHDFLVDRCGIPKEKMWWGRLEGNDSQWLTDACEEKLRACVAAGNVVHVHGPGKMFKPDRLAEIIEIHWDKDWVKTVQLFARRRSRRSKVVRTRRSKASDFSSYDSIRTTWTAAACPSPWQPTSTPRCSRSTSSSPTVAATSVVSVGRGS